MSEFQERAEVVIDLFRDLFDGNGQRFGSLSLGVLGISDGREGVQSNAGYSRSEQSAWLGVNLEGKKYDDWPVAQLIERELSQPRLLTGHRPRVAKPGRVTVSWSRDAWPSPSGDTCQAITVLQQMIGSPSASESKPPSNGRSSHWSVPLIPVSSGDPTIHRDARVEHQRP